MPLTKRHLTLHISTLEAIAAVVNVICAHRIIGGTDHLPQDLCFEAHVDAQATTQVLIKGRARSPMMQIVHSSALMHPAFVEMLPFLLVLHCFGLGNVASDAASRGYDSVLKQVSAALGLKMVRVDPPEMAIVLLDACLAEHGKLEHEHCWGHRGERIGDADHPGPFFQPLKSAQSVAIDGQTAKPRQLGAVQSAVKRKANFQPFESAQSRTVDEPTADLEQLVEGQSATKRQAIFQPMQSGKSCLQQRRSTCSPCQRA